MARHLMQRCPVVGAGFALALLLAPAPAAGQARGGAPDTAAVTPGMVLAGRVIFHTRGTCFACHGPKLEGTQIAPTLVKKQWRDATNGELKNIFYVVTHGVRGTLMVAFPGAISRQDAANVAAYVWSVNHRGTRP